MPRRQTQLRGPKDRDQSSKKQQPKKQSRKGLDAFAIAESELPYKPKIRRNRLGENDDLVKRKRHPGHDEDDDFDDSDGPDNKRRRTRNEGADYDENAGSDGEGNRWRIGEVDSDDDSDLDSDEAMGSSDEERFEGFTFRGSSKNKSQPKKKTAETKKRGRKVTLSEDTEESEEEEDEEDDDDLGEDAIDLTTAWDMNEAAEKEEAAAAAKAQKAAAGEDSDEADSESEDSDDSNEESELSMSDDEMNGNDEHGLSKLQNFVNSMDPESTNKSTKKARGGQEHANPTEFGLTSTKKLTVADLLPSITDSRLKNSLKHVDSTASSQKPSSGIPGKLDAPLPKRQQDRLDREAAYEKSKETLDRWLDTVKANRRAEHLMFPLPDPDAQQVHRIAPAQPRNDLENTIQNILVESGLAENSGKTGEEQVQEFEELQARKLPIEEIRARRAELRKRRDLLFREEVRAKRIKKIKSKSYRRVHRKEREKLEQQERQALLEAGVDMDEQDQEANDRRRAEARMGSKHKESKWAKSLKQTGRTAWDEDARLGAADLAQKEEELRKRIEGKSVSHGNEDYLGSSSSESEDDDDPWDEEAGAEKEKRKIHQKLKDLEGDEGAELEAKGPHANLFSMKFMQNAEATRKAQNDAEVRKLNRELHGEESQSEAESEVGRRKFGQSATDKSAKANKPKPLPRNEFEEAPGSDDEEGPTRGADEGANAVLDRPDKKQPARSNNKPRGRPTGGLSEQKEEDSAEENPWLVQTNRNNRRTTTNDSQQTVDISVNDAQPKTAGSKSASKNQPKAVAALKNQQLDGDNDSDEDSVPVLLKNHDLVKRAFAGDEVVQEFEDEKMDTIKDEGDQVIDNTMPGWGSWAGDGISKKQQKRQKRSLTTVEGVKPENRKDAKLSRVIINEKRVQKNKKYMATQLPHQFETRQQYERSLRIPIGPEWSTKETFQGATKPRVMIKQGVIKPMEKPTI
ncbi:Utp14-domain-containing protein [Aspergillus steynii IBT 23096]|uniref:Utp14-domain-containing protein n=1 Tax=Aspergillus steynii IBT 23096 TaxID=1392250 RepID=A0A2I2GQQ8_9EURO|nr:Utp14-domain-containing protein [Aspergillus steynii IBT 23096]PLB55216.1 Utp14-domain-containing protein [Aspergillus steynii IBT 23096]